MELEGPLDLFTKARHCTSLLVESSPVMIYLTKIRFNIILSEPMFS
jgi:hypothetical protein